MGSAAASLFAEFVIPFVSFVLETCIYILIASVRPWRFLLSPTFRAEINARHAHRHSLIKWWHLLWGTFLLVASLAVVYGLFWFLASNQPEPKPTLQEQAVEKIEKTIIDKFKQH